MMQLLHILKRYALVLPGIALLVLCSLKTKAQTTLTLGDIVISSFNGHASVGNDTFSFVLLKAVSSATPIYFSDRGYTVATNTFATATSTEGEILWTSTTALAVGTEVVIAQVPGAGSAATAYSTYAAGNPSVQVGTCAKTAVNGNSTYGISLNDNGGDQIFAYQNSMTTANLITGLHYNYCSGGSGTTDASWDPPSANCGNFPAQATSEKPSTLVTGTSAFWTGAAAPDAYDEGAYNCSAGSLPSSDVNVIRQEVYDKTNWQLSTNISGNINALPNPPGCMYYGVTPPVVTVDPTNKAICVNGSTTFSVTATGSGLGYQWQVSTTGTGGTYNNVSGGNYTNATTATLTVSSTPAGFNGYAYRCVVSNGGGSDNSAGATLAVSNGVPVISGHPSDASICPNGNTTFTVTSSGPTLSYQWQVNTGSGFLDVAATAPYSGVTTATLTLTSVPSTYYGYLYRCVVTNPCGSTNSNSATLRFNTNWTGTTNTAWNTASNWSCGVPTADVDATIGAAGNLPSVNISNAVCRNLAISSTLTMASSSGLQIMGNLTNTGTFNATASTATVNFASAGTQTIGSGSFNNLTISGGGNKNLGGSISVAGTLTMTSGKLLLGANTVTIGNTGSISGANQTNYLVTNGTGELQIDNIGTGGKTGIVLFPVGPSTTSYVPLRVQNAGVADNFTGRVIDGVYAAYTGNVPQGGPLTNNVVNKTWFVSEQTAGGSNATLTVQWNATDELGTFNNTAVTLSHYTAGGWDPMPLTAASGFDPYTVSRTGLSSFSPFGVGNAASPLPVVWKSFEGRYDAGVVQLDWSVASEEQVKDYEVQRSEDGLGFVTIGSQKAKGGSGVIAYRHTDATAVAPAYWYRIRLNELNEGVLYSPVIRLTTGRENDIRLLSNPVGDNIVLEMTTLQNGAAEILISDISGRKISKQSASVKSGTQLLTLPAPVMAAGQVYLLQVTLNGQRELFKIIR